jgi:beta-galactosidase
MQTAQELGAAEKTMKRERLLLDFDWKFHHGEVAVAAPTTHGDVYGASKANGARGPAGTSFSDQEWETVDLPHDWVVGGTFDSANIMNQGYLARGKGWYRRTFVLDNADRDSNLSIEFDGVATHCTVWLNGHLLWRNWCGYTGFSISISDIANYGDTPNILSVEVDADAFEGWWYEGGGIYRHVWLVKTHPACIAQWGAFVNPLRQEDGNWKTQIETTLENHAPAEQHITLKQTIIGPDNRVVGSCQQDAIIPALGSIMTNQHIIVENPQLWSCDTPALYRVETSLLQGNNCLDRSEATFGYRSLRFCPDTGFYLNDVPIKIKGACNHQDHAGLGLALPDKVNQYRIQRLKDLGCNAYRTAHNPPTPELLDACDRMGMLVLDEIRHFSSSQEGLAQLRSMVQRDRNHPSVFMWCILNEEPLQGTSTGQGIARTMVATIKDMDDSRPATASMNGGHFNDGVGSIIDVVGFNYYTHLYNRYHELHPNQPMLATETAATCSTRGEYANSDDLGYCDAYDSTSQAWASSARDLWRAVSASPFVMGAFVWSGFDYRGEPTPLHWPCINSHFGVMDTCGFPKDGYYLYQAMWKNEPILHLLPHWNWPDREGENIKVCAYTNCETAELFLNGKSLGVQTIDICEQSEWQVPYEAGTLSVVGRNKGEVVLEKAVETTGAPTRICMETDTGVLAADMEDAALIKVFAVDAQGRPVPTAQNFIRFRLDGSAKLLGVGNGDPSCHESDKAPMRSLFNGLCQVIIGACASPGQITLIAESEGLETATLTIAGQPAERRPYVKKTEYKWRVVGWRMSQVTQAKPDANVRIDDQDMNSWEPVELGHGPQGAFANNQGYAAYHAFAMTPGFAADTAQATLVFDTIMGSADVFVNGKQREARQNGNPSGLRFDLPDCPPAEYINISVVLHSKGHQGGITGNVWIVVCER